jgi:hypothetical protein
MYKDKDGRHQAIYRRLWPMLIPAEGRSRTTYGELLRVASIIYHDVHNNGGDNIHGPQLQYCIWTLLSWGEEIGQRVPDEDWDYLSHVLRNWGRVANLDHSRFSDVLERTMDAVIEIVNQLFVSSIKIQAQGFVRNPPTEAGK